MPSLSDEGSSSRDAGKTFVREVGTPEAPHTVLLVHGWLASAGLNWASVFEPLGDHFRVVAADLRGHGRGIRSRRRFRLEDCADDLAVLVDQLGCGPVIVVGYSMGGLIAQLLWRRHPELVAGLVLCSTTRAFVPGRRERYLFGTTMNYAAGTVRLSRLATRWYPAGLRPLRGLRPGRTTSLRVSGRPVRCAVTTCVRSSRRAMPRASSTPAPWIGDVDVPTAVVMTTQDRAIPLDAQCQLADSIGNATVHSIDDDHTACAHASFAPVLLAACRDVATRVDQLAVVTGPRSRGRRRSSARCDRWR